MARPSRTRRRALRLALALGALLPTPSLAATDRPGDEPRRLVGSLHVSTQGRARVRGGRIEGAPVHAAWVGSGRRFDADERDALAAFERALFPTGSGVHDRAPKPWMADLALPDLPIRWTRRTVEYLQYFRDSDKGQALMRGWLRRAGRYEPTLRKILADGGVPADLVFVALAESGFDPRARSRVGAAGLWQFMESTGSVYGLTRDYWVDERHDIVKSTQAAALFLSDLHTRFGTWELALAAYNAGYGLVMVSIDRHNTNDFWRLCDIESGLPYATVNYVPKIMAASLVGRNREAFKVDDAAIDPAPAVDWVEVKVVGKTKLATLAKAIGVEATLLEELNAQYVRGRTPPGRGRFTVRIPRAARDAFDKAHPKLEAEVATLKTHTMRHGDQLAAIARAHDTSERALRRLNGVRDSAELEGGTVILLPPPDPKHASSEVEPPPLAAVPPLQVPAQQRLVFFETNRATTPAVLTRAFGVTWSAIADLNELDPRARIQGGQVLQVLVERSWDAAARGVAAYEVDEVEHVIRGSRAHIEAGLSRRGLQRRAHKVRKGDTLDRIARRYDLTIGDIARINAIPRSHAPKVGDLLVVYVASRKAGGTLRAPDPRGAPIAHRSASTAGSSKTPGSATPRKPAKAAPSDDAKNERKPSTPQTAGTPGGGRSR